MRAVGRGKVCVLIGMRMVDHAQPSLRSSISSITASAPSDPSGMRCVRRAGTPRDLFRMHRVLDVGDGRTSSTALSPMMKPQHSNGNSRSACATIASMLARRIDDLTSSLLLFGGVSAIDSKLSVADWLDNGFGFRFWELAVEQSRAVGSRDGTDFNSIGRRRAGRPR